MNNNKTIYEIITLDKAIRHCYEVYHERDDMCKECREEHRQIALWLEELKESKKIINRLKVNEEKNENIIRLDEKTIEKQQAEIERLQNEIGREFICFVGDPHKVEHCPYLEEIETAKSEARKEFAERLDLFSKVFKPLPPYSDHIVISRQELDNLLKEMEGE